MREISCNEITKVVENLCKNSNFYLNDDIRTKIQNSLNTESSDIGKSVLNQLLENAEIAKTEKMAMCQDTGMVVVFIDIGQNVRIVDGILSDSINQGVRNGYKNGYFRNSVVNDPILRENTNDNTPAIIHYNILPGDELKIIVSPKGFGSENMSSLKMLKPSDGIEGIKKFIIDTVDSAGPNPCPPIVVGVGIGGTMEKAAILSKRALQRSINVRSSHQHIESLEIEILEKINKLGIGPAGFGGTTTALGVNIEVYPTHIAGLPVAVNISCHASRHNEYTF